MEIELSNKYRTDAIVGDGLLSTGNSVLGTCKRFNFSRSSQKEKLKPQKKNDGNMILNSEECDLDEN